MSVAHFGCIVRFAVRRSRTEGDWLYVEVWGSGFLIPPVGKASLDLQLCQVYTAYIEYTQRVYRRNIEGIENV